MGGKSLVAPIRVGTSKLSPYKWIRKHINKIPPNNPVRQTSVKHMFTQIVQSQMWHVTCRPYKITESLLAFAPGVSGLRGFSGNVSSYIWKAASPVQRCFNGCISKRFARMQLHLAAQITVSISKWIISHAGQIHLIRQILVAPSTGWMLYYLCFSPSTAIGPPSAIGSAIGRPLSRPISHPNTGGSPQPPRSKPLGGLNRAIVVL